MTAPKPSASINKVLPQFADLPAAAAEEIKSLADAQKRIAQLEREARAANKPVDPKAIESAEARGEARGQQTAAAELRRLRGIVTEREVRLSTVAVLVERIHKAAHLNGEAGAHLTGRESAPARAILPPAPKNAEQHVVSSGRKPAGETRNLLSAGPLGKGERAVLTAIAQHQAGVSREQLTILTGYKRSSRDTYLQRLRSAALIEDGPVIIATGEGIEALGHDFEPLPVGDALREFWANRLTCGELTLFQAICEVHPDAISRDDLSDQTAYKRSSRDTYLQRLSSRKLIVATRDGVVAADALFG
jgi:hypothetical protein